MNIPNIDEVKESVEILKTIQADFSVDIDKHSGKEVYNTPAVFSYEKNYKKAFDLIISLASAVINVSEKMLPKIKDEDMPEHEQKHLFDLYQTGYNAARSEIILWLTKMVMLGKIKLNGIDISQ